MLPRICNDKIFDTTGILDKLEEKKIPNESVALGDELWISQCTWLNKFRK